MDPAPPAAVHDGRYPVSVKAVPIDAGRVVLLRNARAEWELPGGRLEPGETPQTCVRREVREELSVDAEIGPILDCWVYQPVPGRNVVIVTYGGAAALDRVARSAEHDAVAVVALDEVARLRMPDGYRASIARWRRLRDAWTPG